MIYKTLEELMAREGKTAGKRHPHRVIVDGAGHYYVMAGNVDQAIARVARELDGFHCTRVTLKEILDVDGDSKAR